eukprot:30362-Pelagococcus_subviridis.AAC.2
MDGCANHHVGILSPFVKCAANSASSLSEEAYTTSKSAPRDRSASEIFVRVGRNARHGPHQLAPKYTATILPPRT